LQIACQGIGLPLKDYSHTVETDRDLNETKKEKKAIPFVSLIDLD